MFEKMTVAFDAITHMTSIFWPDLASTNVHNSDLLKDIRTPVTTAQKQIAQKFKNCSG
jgi:hypothetical protein